MWNSERTLAILDSHDGMEGSPYGMPFIRWTGDPAFVREFDFIGGLIVREIANSEHAGKPAVRFGLADEMGERSIGRFVVSREVGHEESLEWLRIYDDPADFQREHDAFLNDGWEKIEARLVLVGDWIKDPEVEGDKVTEGLVTSVEIVPASVRGGETGLAIDLEGTDGYFWDRDLDDVLLRKIKS